MNPYEELGVPRDATPEDIKKAARKRAKATHPDAGGTAEAFEKTQRALAVLSDPKRREHYDRTGKDEEPAPDNSQAQIMGLVATVTLQIVESEFDFERNNLVDELKRHFAQNIAAAKLDRAQKRAQIGRLDKAMKRAKRKKGAGPNLLVKFMTDRKNDLIRTVEQVDEAIKTLEAALAIVGEYDWETDPSMKAYGQPLGSIFGAQTSTASTSNTFWR